MQQALGGAVHDRVASCVHVWPLIRLQVIFRPLKMQQYSDHIEIFVNDSHSFTVMIEAYTPAIHVQVCRERCALNQHHAPAGLSNMLLATHLLQVPSSLDFGFVPCKELQTRPLLVRNTGDVKVSPTPLDHTGAICVTSLAGMPTCRWPCHGVWTPPSASPQHQRPWIPGSPCPSRCPSCPRRPAHMQAMHAASWMMGHQQSAV